MAAKEKLYTDSKGITLPAKEWSKILGIKPGSVRSRFRLGKDVGANRYNAELKYICPISGRRLSVSQWASYLEIDESSFKKRLRQWGANDPRTFARPLSRINEPNNELLTEQLKRRGSFFAEIPIQESQCSLTNGLNTMGFQKLNFTKP